MMRTGLVLAGGAARGAYEVGVLQHIVGDVARATGRAAHVDLISGTSVGAIHACALAARADDPVAAVDNVASAWRSMRLDDMLHVAGRSIAEMALAAFGCRHSRQARGGFLRLTPFAKLVRDRVPFDRIAGHIAAGRLTALTVSATHVATGRTVVFVQQGGPLPVVERRPADIVLQPARLGPEHALASAAVPLLFPAVAVDDELYCDGGLRQLVPLWPALRLGADAFIVVSPRSETVDESPGARQRREQAVASPVYLAGKSLDALLLDHVDEDLDRLRQTNAVLRAGSRRYGPEFVTEINRELRREGAHDLRPIRAAVVRPSRDIGALAADFVRAPGFARRHRGVAAWLLRLLAEAEGSRETDLVSYLLFDGEFAELLIELGRADARARHDDLCAVYESEVRAA